MMRLRVLAVVAVVGIGIGQAMGQSAPEKHRGRKYKVPPATSHVEVTVLKGDNAKPLVNAAVIFHPVKDGKDEGNLEVKTNDEGKAIIDVIPTGSMVGVQVLADGFATFAGDYLVDKDAKDILVKMIRPRAQISTYQDNQGLAKERPDGVQESKGPSTPSVIEAPKTTNHTSDPTAPAPVGRDATPGNTQNNQTIAPKTGVPPQ